MQKRTQEGIKRAKKDGKKKRAKKEGKKEGKPETVRMPFYDRPGLGLGAPVG